MKPFTQDLAETFIGTALTFAAIAYFSPDHSQKASAFPVGDRTEAVSQEPPVFNRQEAVSDVNLDKLAVQQAEEFAQSLAAE